MKKTGKAKHEAWELKQMQSLSLASKIRMTVTRIKDWYNFYDGNVYLSYSGGKDSSVLLHITKTVFSDIPVVYVDTGLELPAVRKIALEQADVVLKPDMHFSQVLNNYGYPLVSKEVSSKIEGARKGQNSSLRHFNGIKQGRYDYRRWAFLLESPFLISAECCNKTKKSAVKKYAAETGRKAIVATMADESELRRSDWLMHGCNAFDAKRPVSKPMSFWTEQDVLEYIKMNDLKIPTVYGSIVSDNGIDSDEFTQLSLFEPGEIPCKFKTTGCDRTGCAFCCYGVHLDSTPNRFELMDKYSCSALRDYCMRGGAFDSDGFWKPTKHGLGYWFVLQYINVHGNKHIFIPEYDRYEQTYGNELTKKYLKRS